MKISGIDKTLAPLYGDSMLATREDPQERLAILEQRLRTQAQHENRNMNDLIVDAVAQYLSTPQSSTAARLSFQRLLREPPLIGSPEEVAFSMAEDFYQQRAIPLLS